MGGTVGPWIRKANGAIILWFLLHTHVEIRSFSCSLESLGLTHGFILFPCIPLLTACEREELWVFRVPKIKKRMWSSQGKSINKMAVAQETESVWHLVISEHFHYVHTHMHMNLNKWACVQSMYDLWCLYMVFASKKFKISLLLMIPILGEVPQLK